MFVVSHFDTPAGCLEVAHDGHFIRRAVFAHATPTFAFRSAFCEKIFQAITLYRNDPSISFSLPLAPLGTVYQQRVWHALQHIQSGTVLTYSALARTLHSSPRAIGQACRQNPIAFFIPCHRVVAKTHLGGYFGAQTALTLKQALLQHEGALVDAPCVLQREASKRLRGSV